MMRQMTFIAPLMVATVVDHVLTLKNAPNVNAILEKLAVKFLTVLLETVTAMMLQTMPIATLMGVTVVDPVSIWNTVLNVPVLDWLIAVMKFQMHWSETDYVMMR